MQAERWKQIEDLFQSALDCAPEKRAALLDSACRADVKLRAEVESLLRWHEDGRPTQPALQDALRVMDDRAAHLEEGRRIGPYRIIRELGRGGMGAVYLAARADDTFHKLVAAKLIRRGLDTDDILQRFRSERQILATLDHPNITRLLDAGSTDEGLPFLVMEYIEGEPIDRYCDARKLNITERLKLFQSVCAAVRYAHQNLVIHRDIKPGNVLVTREGVPRLLDFGIAKLLAPGSEPGEATLTTARRLTPEYASPEQLRGEAITTATDVYSLGVLLYRLLTGRCPYPVGRSSPTELEQAICQQDPERPSLAVSRKPPAAWPDEKEPVTRESASATREGTADKLRRRLEGDLDNIVLMAMRKEPERRYSTVEQLSEDISRHLANLPVIARPDTARYRAAKFVLRHRLGVAAAILVLVSLTGGIAAALWQAHIATEQRDRARIEQAKADRIKSFLTDMLSDSSPEYVSGNAAKNQDIKVSEVVDQAAKRAADELADQPEVLAEVQSTIGGVYAAQGRYPQAERMLRAAAESSIRLYGTYSHQSSEVSGALANVLLEEGKSAEADGLFRQNVEIERRLMGEGRGSAKNLAYALAGYGGMLDQRNDRSAEAYLREALKYSTAFRGKERTIVAMLYNDLSNEAYSRGDDEETERDLRASLAEYRNLPAGTYVEEAVTLSNLGALLIREGQYAQAEPFVLQGLEMRRKILGNAHVGTAMAFYRLSDLRYKQARYDEAEKAAQESIEVFRRALATPQDNVLFSNPILEMGMILDKAGRIHDAENDLRQALDIRTRTLPKGNIGIGAAEDALGECLTMQKRYQAAEPLLLESYRIFTSTTVAGDARRAAAAQDLYALYSQWGHLEKAALYKPGR